MHTQKQSATVGAVNDGLDKEGLVSSENRRREHVADDEANRHACRLGLVLCVDIILSRHIDNKNDNAD